MGDAQSSAVAGPLLPAQAGAPRSWTRQIIGGGQIQESCPAWCTTDHRVDALGNLDDLAHRGDEAAAEAAVVDHWEDGEPVSVRVPVLLARIQVDPYSENPRRNVPFATLDVMDGETVDELSPGEFAAFIAQVRDHCDRLLEQMLPQLVQARAGYGVQAG